jgi:hydrogenase maturation factor
MHDGAVLAGGSERLAFSTDSYVVRPLFFPGGDIGSMAVHGTVNDLAMCGARPCRADLRTDSRGGPADGDPLARSFPR